MKKLMLLIASKRIKRIASNHNNTAFTLLNYNTQKNLLISIM
jgi:hypothetical protein